MLRLLVVFARQLEILVTTLDTLIVTPLIPPPPQKKIAWSQVITHMMAFSGSFRPKGVPFPGFR